VNAIYKKDGIINVIFENVIWRVEKFSRNNYPILEGTGFKLSNKYKNFTEDHGFVESAYYDDVSRKTYFTLNHTKKIFVIYRKYNNWADNTEISNIKNCVIERGFNSINDSQVSF